MIISELEDRSTEITQRKRKEKNGRNKKWKRAFKNCGKISNCPTHQNPGRKREGEAVNRRNIRRHDAQEFIKIMKDIKSQIEESQKISRKISTRYKTKATHVIFKLPETKDKETILKKAGEKDTLHTEEQKIFTDFLS